MWDDLPESKRFPRLVVKLSPKRYRQHLAEHPQEGARFVRAAALSGVAEAQLGWGHMLLDGYGVAPDADAALRWFTLAARQGNLDAANMLGRCYELGWGTKADSGAAAHWYGVAAAKSHHWAQFNLAALLLAARGEGADLPRVLTLLVRSARAGNPKAMNMIGHFREKGWAGRRKPKAAALWFRRAAEGGCFRGQFHHARCLLREGKVAEASRWFRSSLRQSPPDFAHDAGNMLLRHPSERIQSIAREVLGSREERAS